MRDWNYSPDHPISLTISADARLDPTDYTDDQIWELNLGSSEPPAVSLQTTFGLRARSCRIFPRFILGDHSVNNPAHFHHPVTIHQYYPNYIKLSFKPYSNINVVLEYWVPDSHTITCRTKIINTSRDVCQFRVEWAELLIPAEDGNRMSTQEIGVSTILAGHTSNLVPVLFLTAGSQPGKSSYPSLGISYKIPPHGEQQLSWSHASLNELNASYEKAKEAMSRNWDSEFARIQRMNSQRLEITTGNQEWDTAFYLAQTIVDQLFLQPTSRRGSQSYVFSRNPDQGFSLLQDGSDYNHLWNGQTALGSYYLTNFLLPSSPELLKSLLDNFLASQNENGEIDFKPGLGGQRSHLLATPLLASLTWLYYQYTSSPDYLISVFPKLLGYYFSWFKAGHDRDGDSIPEWDQTIQTGFEEHPLFSYQGEISPGLDITVVESPDLCSYLYREGISLIAIANEITERGSIPQLQGMVEHLKSMVEQSWDDTYACFLYRDRDSHISTSSEILGILTGTGTLDIHRNFHPPVRPVFQMTSQSEGTRPIQIYIHGIASNGAHRVDHISPGQIHWHMQNGYHTSEYIYETIEHIEISGLLSTDELTVRTLGINRIDQTLLIPLWAGIPSEEKAKILINLTIMNKKMFLSQYGLRSIIDSVTPDDHATGNVSIQLAWMSLIMEGLIYYGERKNAAELFTRSMKAVVNSLKRDLSFHQFYHPETGQPFGPANSLTSLIPVGIFLNILGVKIINSSKVELTGSNPFPWPVTIKYRGLTVVQQEKKALIIFSDGQNITVDNNQPKIINREEPIQH
jgi:hypothetical protein